MIKQSKLLNMLLATQYLADNSRLEDGEIVPFDIHRLAFNAEELRRIAKDFVGEGGPSRLYVYGMTDDGCQLLCSERELEDFHSHGFSDMLFTDCPLADDERPPMDGGECLRGKIDVKGRIRLMESMVSQPQSLS